MKIQKPLKHNNSISKKLRNHHIRAYLKLEMECDAPNPVTTDFSSWKKPEK